MIKYTRELQVRIEKLHDSGLNNREIGDDVGLTGRQVRHILEKTKKGFTYPSRDIIDEPVEVMDDKDDKTIYFEEEYFYNRDSDVYVTFIRGLPKPIAIPGDTHRAMKRAYSDWDGQPSTINQICRDFGMSRATFTRYKQAHGWTHDSEPFTEEEIEERDLDDMVDEAIQMRKQSLWQKYEKRKWAETKSAAEKWNRFEQSILLPLKEMVGGLERWNIEGIENRTDKDVMAVWSLFCDLHYGKYGWRAEVGETYNRNIATRRVLESLAKIVPMIKGKISMLVLPIGSDDEHIDNYSGTTTSGTEQDRDGSPAQIIFEYGQLLVNVVSKLSEVLRVPIYLVNVPGNHNRHTAILRGQFANAWFRDTQHINVMNVAATRAYIKFGVNLVGFAHGDSARLASLPMIMASEKKEEWGECSSKVWITNHRHKDTEMMPNSGARIFVTPALSGEDRWHHRKGFINKNPSSGVYLFHKKRGFIGNYIAIVE